MSGSVNILTIRGKREVGFVKAVFISPPGSQVVRIVYPTNNHSTCPPDEVLPREKFFNGVIARSDGTTDILAIRGR